MKSVYTELIELETELNRYKITLFDVISKFKEYLFLKDTQIIEIVLAVILSNQLDGTPIWIIFCGASGDAKSTHLNAIEQLNNVIWLDQLTKNTLASGHPKVKDLGEKLQNSLQNSSHILVIPDMACISSKYKDERKEIFASMRNLYDGYIIKHTGSGVNKQYKDCHVSLIAGATPIIKREYLIHQQLGSRELIFDTDAIIDENDEKMKQAWDNEQYEQQMKEELQSVVSQFVKDIQIKEIEFSDEIKEYLMKQANRLSILRAVGDYNQFNDELECDLYLEVPTRLIKQLKRLWICLKSLDDDYSDDRCKEIIEHVVKSSGNSNRSLILEILKESKEDSFSVNAVKYETKLGYRAVKRELEALWNLGLIIKKGHYISKSESKVYDIASYQIDLDRYNELLT
jgi:hypothetical protein